MIVVIVLRHIEGSVICIYVFVGYVNPIDVVWMVLIRSRVVL